jgi:HEPN domain-containing protein
LSKSEGMLRMIIADLDLAKYALSRKTDAGINMAAYHTQQAIEKSLKTLILLSGRKYPYTHDLEVLVTYVDDSRFKLPNWMDDRLAGPSNWESKTRYMDSPVTTYKNVQLYIKRAEDLYCYILKTLNLVKNDENVTHTFDK